MATFIVERLFARFGGLFKFVTSWGEKVDIKKLMKEVKELSEDEKELDEWIKEFDIERIEEVMREEEEKFKKLDSHSFDLLTRDLLVLSKVIGVFKEGKKEAKKLASTLEDIRKRVKEEGKRRKIEGLIANLNEVIMKDEEEVIKTEHPKFKKILTKTIALINSIENAEKVIKERKERETLMAEFNTFMKNETGETFFSYIAAKSERNEVLREMRKEGGAEKRANKVIGRVRALIQKHKNNLDVDSVERDVSEFIEDYNKMTEEDIKAVAAGVLLVLRTLLILFSTYKIIMTSTGKIEEAKKNYIIPTVMDDKFREKIVYELKNFENDLRGVWKGEQADTKRLDAAT